jgi:hypothetical protein
MTDRPLCPLGCVDGYLVVESGERFPCPHCQATRLEAMARARDALGPQAIAAARRRFGDPRQHEPDPDQSVAERLLAAKENP